MSVPVGIGWCSRTRPPPKRQSHSATLLDKKVSREPTAERRETTLARIHPYSG